jgi:hypothetical protein
VAPTPAIFTASITTIPASSHDVVLDEKVDRINVDLTRRIPIAPREYALGPHMAARHMPSKAGTLRLRPGRVETAGLVTQSTSEPHAAR